jgi:hypothetical protein
MAVVAGAQTPAPPGVNVKLSFVDNKTIYKIGEPIKLVMEFTADRDGYIVEYLPDAKEPGMDTTVVTPESGVTRWLDELNYRRGLGRDYMATDKLTNTPRRVEFFLNDTVRFDAPGRYTVSVNTRRIWKTTPSSGDTKTLPTSTNSISFEVVPMTELEEETEVKRIVDLLASRRDPRGDDELGLRLSYLTGDPSTREKVKRFLSNDSRKGNFNAHMSYGLYIASNRPLVLKLLEDAMRDPSRPVTSQLLGVATSLKMFLTHNVREQPATPTAALEYTDPRVTEISDAYVMELAAGLGKRSGDSQTTTATTILMALPKDSQAATAGLREVRRILVQQFDTLHPFSQENLLQIHWEQLRDPALVPSLKKMLAATGTASSHLRGVALKRLLELAPDDARPYVIAEIRDPQSLVDREVLGQLKDESLPEVDASLLEQLRRLVASDQPHDNVWLRVKTPLLVRFATANIYGSVLELYRASRARTMWPEPRAALLAYLAKQNELEAVPLIEQAISEVKPGSEPTFLSELTKLYYSDAIGALLKKLLETEDAAHASHAAYLIGRQGSAGDEQVLEARLKRWREQWGNRLAEAEAQSQGQVERELIDALIRGKSWKLPAERVRELQQSCITKICKDSFQRQ